MNIQMLKRAIGTLFVLALLVPGARAAEVAGTVLYTTGKVTAVAADGSRRDLQRRSPVHAGDLLQTAAGARAQVRFTDGGIVALKPGSELRLDDYVDGDAVTAKNVMSLIKGGFRTMTGAIGQRNKAAYKVNTPVATIGVRGTLYEASYSEDQGLALGVWDGGITACNDSGCVDLGMNADHRFGFVPVGGKPQGTRESPAGLGDDAAGDGGDAAGGLGSLGGDGVAASDFQPASLFGPAVEVTRENYKQVGYAFLAGGGVISAGYSRVDVDATSLPPKVTGWAMVDDASGIELSPAPPTETCISVCVVAPSFNATTWLDINNDPDMTWGDWNSVSVGMSAGSADTSISAADGGFVMADYIAPDQANAWLNTWFSVNSTLWGYFGGGSAADGGKLLWSPSMSGSFTLDVSGQLTGNLSVNGFNDGAGTWDIAFTGAVVGGQLTGMAIDSANSQYTSADTLSTNQVAGHIEASLFESAGGVGGIVGGVEASTVGANASTGKVETLEAVFVMSPNAG
ncbi:MAG: FecR domain-containing protein [Gammaproteobacteria bacterium]